MAGEPWRGCGGSRLLWITCRSRPSWMDGWTGVNLKIFQVNKLIASRLLLRFRTSFLMFKLVSMLSAMEESSSDEDFPIVSYSMNDSTLEEVRTHISISRAINYVPILCFRFL